MLVATLSPAFATENLESKEIRSAHSYITVENIKAKTAKILAIATQAIILDSDIKNSALPSAHLDTSSPEVPPKKVFFEGIRTELTPHTKFILGNSDGLRLGVEFKLSSTSSKSPEYGNAKLGVGILNQGLGIQYISQF